ncbi:MAG: cytochrome C biogenesis protein ResB [Nitrospirae bacterium]|nr:cytochrome C biogenesis protein ResB [Nitrospirota bacterium]
MPDNPGFGSIDIPLFDWLKRQNLESVWWLWGTIGVLSLLSVNTLFCSIDSIIKKRRVTHWLLLISPQVIHTGFLFMLLAHLLGASGSYHGEAAVAEGSAVKLSGGDILAIKNIEIETDDSGYLSGWGVDIEYNHSGNFTESARISPNSPFIYKDLNIMVKDVQAYPEAALLQVSRDPGAVWALAGSILFTLGILTLIALRMKMEKT